MAPPRINLYLRLPRRRLQCSFLTPSPHPPFVLAIFPLSPPPLSSSCLLAYLRACVLACVPALLPVVFLGYWYISSTLPDYFGNEENHEARASTHPNLARGLPSFGRCPQAPPVAVSAASSRNSGSGGRNSGTCRSGSDRRSPAAAATVTPASKHAVFAGGRKVPVGKPRRASSKASLAGTAPVGPAAAGGGNRTARPRPRRQPPPPPSQSPRSVSMDSDKMSAACWSKDGGGCAAVGDGGTSFSRAASRVALRAARAKGLAVTLPAALFVPSRLMDSTAASRAGVYTPPNGGKDESASAAATSVAAAMVTPRRLAPPRRRRSLGVVAGVSEGGDAISTAAAAAAAAASTAVSASAGAREVAESYDIASTGSCGSGSSGRKRELQERTGFMHLSDEVRTSTLFRLLKMILSRVASVLSS